VTVDLRLVDRYPVEFDSFSVDGREIDR